MFIWQPIFLIELESQPLRKHFHLLIMRIIMRILDKWPYIFNERSKLKTVGQACLHQIIVNKRSIHCKDVSISICVFFSIFFFIFTNIAGTYRKVNAEFNKLIRARLFSKHDVEHTHLCQQLLTLFWHFKILTYQVLKL